MRVGAWVRIPHPLLYESAIAIAFDEYYGADVARVSIPDRDSGDLGSIPNWHPDLWMGWKPRGVATDCNPENGRFDSCSAYLEVVCSVWRF
jgi:hypothetical protein